MLNNYAHLVRLVVVSERSQKRLEQLGKFDHQRVISGHGWLDELSYPKCRYLIDVRLYAISPE